MDCPNLRTLYPQFKIDRDPSAGPREQDPWNWQIPCQFGHVYPHGPDLLGVSTNSRGAIAKRIAALDCVQVTQDGSDGINATFNLADANAVFAIIKPRKRRRLSDDQKAAAVARFSLRKAQPSAILAA
ncbi:MAG: hypothetical protein WD063_08550 [Pirellulales bacterium]